MTSAPGVQRASNAVKVLKIALIEALRVARCALPVGTGQKATQTQAHTITDTDTNVSIAAATAAES